MSYPRTLIVLSFVAVAGFALLAAGCGGGKSPGVASGVGATTTTSAQTGTAAFARCMRSNGVPTFPDPVSSGEIPKVQVVAAAKSNPKFNT
ncbi:MAG TPA: hypothetical protein VGL84_08495, partial [Gaiellaceae bacterium]